ncbi:MAG: Uma2 family endonuclease [Cytophagaceae bacterium]|nr:Uma2 family endonuclease [Cytophagaceae bacterium]
MLTKPRKVASPSARRTRQAIPDALIYEIMDGKPLYYKGYRDVLAGKKNLEEIMGSSTLQWVIASFFMELMILNLDRKRYRFASNEAGVHIDHRNNLAHDVAIYDRQVLTPDKINKKYADVPALVAVEIDVQADLSKATDWQYIARKTRKLLEFGTQKVIWVFSDSRQVMVAEHHADAWLTMEWNRDIELLDGQFFNIGNYLADEGIEISVD